MFIIIEFEEMWVETKNSHVKSDDKKIQGLSSYKGVRGAGAVRLGVTAWVHLSTEL